jgi:hypothetical protein
MRWILRELLTKNMTLDCLEISRDYGAVYCPNPTRRNKS